MGIAIRTDAIEKNRTGAQNRADISRGAYFFSNRHHFGSFRVYHTSIIILTVTRYNCFTCYKGTWNKNFTNLVSHRPHLDSIHALQAKRGFPHRHKASIFDGLDINYHYNMYKRSYRHHGIRHRRISATKLRRIDSDRFGQRNTRFKREQFNLKRNTRIDAHYNSP